MRIFSLFELLLCIFCVYALFGFEGEMRVTVPIICLVTVFLFEILQSRMKEPDEQVEIAQSIREKGKNA